MPEVVCFGEILWDLLPTGKVAGGAPFNVAVHLRQLGVDSPLVSRVGGDALGEALLAFLREKNLPEEYLQRDERHPTGTVRVELSPQGQPSYEIVQPVAWDFIEATPAARAAVAAARAFVFGTLAGRSPQSRASLLELLEVAAFPVLDVNLRAPFYSEQTLAELLPRARLVKMNDEELALLGEWFAGGAEPTALLERFQWEGLIVTYGARGAALFTPTQTFRVPGVSVEVADTVGAGDAFLGAFLSRFLRGAPPDQCLRFAVAAGALVASRSGGTPPLSEAEVHRLMEGASPEAP